MNAKTFESYFFKSYKLLIVSSLGLMTFHACQLTPKANTEQQQLLRRYPKAQNITWDSTENGLVAMFNNDTLNCEATFDSNGVLQFASIFIEVPDLPAALRQKIATQYPTATLTLAVRVEQRDTRSYQLELVTATEYINLLADAKGNIVSETKKPLSEKEMENLEEEGVDDDEE